MASTSMPPTFVATVASLHRVAEQIVSPARKPDKEISLQATPGGYGTPVFEFDGVEHQVRVEGTELVHRTGEQERRAALTTLGDARKVVADLLPGAAGPADGALEIDPAAARILADWYALGDAVLEELVAGARPEDAPSPVRLWPEHFDIAIELGDDTGGQRANYGFSPGDDDHAEPYAYVGPWTAEVSGELWNATGFRGAELTHAELVAAADPRALALDFFTTRRNALADIARRTG